MKLSRQKRSQIYFPFVGVIVLLASVTAWVSFLGLRSFQTNYMEQVSHDALLRTATTPSYELAKRQSFGFFDDAFTDQQWMRAQTIHSKLFPNHFRSNLLKFSNKPGDKGNFAALKHSKDWYGENFQVEFHCPLAQRIPADSNADGPKWVCE